MPCRISRLLCCTSLQKHSTWNTNWIRSEQYWCGGHSGRCWRSGLRKELEFYKRFLTDTQMENGRHRVFNFSTSPFDNTLLNNKLVYVFKELKFAAKVNLAFAFLLKNIEYGMCKYFYAHENNTIMERGKLVNTQADMTNLKGRMHKMDTVEICTRELAKRNGNFTNLQV